MTSIIVSCSLSGTGHPTETVDLRFARVPCIGEEVQTASGDYRVTLVIWREDGPRLDLSYLDSGDAR